MGLGRLQRVATMLWVLLMVGASAQAAVCRLTCALEATGPACHAVMPGMPGMQMASADAAPRTASVVLAVEGCVHGTCVHEGTSATLEGVTQKIRSVPLVWSRVELPLVAHALRSDHRVLAEGRLPAPHRFDPVLLSLRV